MGSGMSRRLSIAMLNSRDHMYWCHLVSPFLILSLGWITLQIWSQSFSALFFQMYFMYYFLEVKREDLAVDIPKLVFANVFDLIRLINIFFFSRSLLCDSGSILFSRKFAIPFVILSCRTFVEDQLQLILIRNCIFINKM